MSNIHPSDPDFLHHLEAFPSDWLSAHHLKGKQVNVEISEYFPAIKYYNTKTNSEEHKPGVKFKGKDKTLLLCKTNSNSIAALHGNNANEWIGKMITIYDDGKKYFDKVGAIRVKSKVPK